MSDIEGLVAAKAEADAALAAAEADALHRLVAAKDTYRANPTAEGKAEKDAAATELRALREVVRADRTGPAVAGDAFLSTEQNGG